MIELRSVTKLYPNGTAAVEDLSFEIASRELCVLVGPSGCGKTTTLKMINRLVEPTSGEIFLDDVNLLKTDPVQLRRHIGYVMQQGGLFPHLRVADNVATVPRLLGWDKERVARRVEELLDLVGLDPAIYLRRYPHELSGGERQRVGVARALGGDPPVLLMDEPFGAVDPVVRKRLQEEFKDLQKRLDKTVVFVTHDIDEALTLGTRIAIMRRGGVLEQFDTPSAILAKPATPFVSEFIGVDRDLQRLSVVTLGAEDLTSVPTAASDATPEMIRALGSGADRTPVMIIDRDGRPLGLIHAEDVGRGGVLLGELIRPLATLPLGSTLKSALARMLQSDESVIAVRDGDRYVGLLTLDGLHGAMRRSAGSPPTEIAEDDPTAAERN
jgi:osmoprotectant transport system ATP-binding protein